MQAPLAIGREKAQQPSSTAVDSAPASHKLNFVEALAPKVSKISAHQQLLLTYFCIARMSPVFSVHVCEQPNQYKGSSYDKRITCAICCVSSVAVCRVCSCVMLHRVQANYVSKLCDNTKPMLVLITAGGTTYHWSY